MVCVALLIESLLSQAIGARIRIEDWFKAELIPGRVGFSRSSGRLYLVKPRDTAT